jgi:iron(III) transport system permease protein
MGRLLNGKQATLIAAALVLTLIGLLPLSLMIASSFRVEGAISLKNYIDVFGNTRTWALFRNSLTLAGLTTVVAGTLGVALAILIAKTDLPLRNALALLFSLPLLLPPYVLAIGWFEVLGRGGLLARSFGAAWGEVTSSWLFGLPGAVLALSSAFLPVVLLLTITYLRGVDSSLEEAARLSSPWTSVLQRITLPLIKPGIVLSLLLVFLLSMGEFGAPAFLRLDVFPVASFTQSSAFYNFGAATAAATPFICIVLSGLLISESLLRNKHYSFRWTGRQNALRVPLGRKSPLALFAVVTSAVLLIGVPLTGVLWRGASPTALTDAVQRAGGSAVRSIFYATIASSVLCILGFFVAYIVQRRALAGWWWLDALTLFLFTLPGAIIGIGLITLWNRPSTNWIYASPALLIMGFVAQYTALGTRTFLAGFSQLPLSLEEAAEISGAGWFRRVFAILTPLLRPATVAAWAVAFIFCLRDLSLPLLLAPPGGDTLTARTMTLMANGSAELVAGLCVLSIGLSVAPLGVLAVAWRSWSKPA